MTGGNLGVQLGRLIFDATMESVGEATLLTGEDTAKALIEYLTLLQFSASWRVAILFPDSCIDSVLDDIRRTGTDLLEDKGLGLTRERIDRFQKERFGQYYAALRQNAASSPSEVLAGTFLDRCTPYEPSSDRLERDDDLERDQIVRDIGNQLEQLDGQIDVFILGFMGNCPATPRCAGTSPHDASAFSSAGSAAGGNRVGSEQLLPMRVNVHPSGPQRDNYIELITADLLEDLNDLSVLKRTLYRGASIVGAGGLALAGYGTYMGDWFTTLVVGAVLLLAGGLANRHQVLRTTRLRQKWMDRFARLDADQLSAFMSELDAKHPLLLAKLGL
jgi:hypothetical protein